MPKTERLKRSNVIILNGNIKINTKGICQQSSKWWSPSKEKWRGRSLRLPFFLNLATLVGLFTKILKNDHWAVRPRVCGVRLFHEILPIKDCHFKLWLLYIVLLKEAKLRGSPTYKRENKEKGIHTVEAEDPPGQIPHPSLNCPGRALQRLCKMAFWGPQGNAELRKGGHILRKWMPHRWPVSVSCTPFSPHLKPAPFCGVCYPIGSILDGPGQSFSLRDIFPDFTPVSPTSSSIFSVSHNSGGMSHTVRAFIINSVELHITSIISHIISKLHNNKDNYHMLPHGPNMPSRGLNPKCRFKEWLMIECWWLYYRFIRAFLWCLLSQKLWYFIGR